MAAHPFVPMTSSTVRPATVLILATTMTGIAERTASLGRIRPCTSEITQIVEIAVVVAATIVATPRTSQVSGDVATSLLAVLTISAASEAAAAVEARLNVAFTGAARRVSWKIRTATRRTMSTLSGAK